MASIRQKNSSVPGKVPLPADLERGELAVNLADQTLFTKDQSDAVVRIEGRLQGKTDLDTDYKRIQAASTVSLNSVAGATPGTYRGVAATGAGTGLTLTVVVTAATTATATPDGPAPGGEGWTITNPITLPAGSLGAGSSASGTITGVADLLKPAPADSGVVVRDPAVAAGQPGAFKVAEQHPSNSGPYPEAVSGSGYLTRKATTGEYELTRPNLAASDSPPSNPHVGMSWLDTGSTMQLYVWNGTAWVLPGSYVPPGTFRAQFDIIATAGAPVTVTIKPSGATAADCIIDWGDSAKSKGVTTASHTYLATKRYTLTFIVAPDTAIFDGGGWPDIAGARVKKIGPFSDNAKINAYGAGWVSNTFYPELEEMDFTGIVPNNLTDFDSLFKHRPFLFPEKIKGVDKDKIGSIKSYMENRLDMATVPYADGAEITDCSKAWQGCYLARFPNVVMPKANAAGFAFQGATIDWFGGIALIALTSTAGREVAPTTQDLFASSKIGTLAGDVVLNNPALKSASSLLRNARVNQWNATFRFGGANGQVLDSMREALLGLRVRECNAPLLTDFYCMTMSGPPMQVFTSANHPDSALPEFGATCPSVGFGGVTGFGCRYTWFGEQNEPSPKFWGTEHATDSLLDIGGWAYPDGFNARFFANPELLKSWNWRLKIPAAKSMTVVGVSWAMNSQYPNLQTVGPGVFDDVEAPLRIGTGFGWFAAAKLTQASVDAVIKSLKVSHDKGGGLELKTLVLNGGSNSAPSAAVIGAEMAALTAAGYTITTN